MSHLPDQGSPGDFPNLTRTNHRVTSPTDDVYNCIAWAAGETFRWWEPGRYWPVPVVPPIYAMTNLVRALQAVGFKTCESGDSADGFERVALYADRVGLYTHAARQLPSGKWASKLGFLEDIEHDTPADVAGGAYGEVVAYMRRPVG